MTSLHVQGWTEPYIHGVHTVLLAWKSPNIRCICTYTYGPGQPYTCALQRQRLELARSGKKCFAGDGLLSRAMESKRSKGKSVFAVKGMPKFLGQQNWNGVD